MITDPYQFNKPCKVSSSLILPIVFAISADLLNADVEDSTSCARIQGNRALIFSHMRAQLAQASSTMGYGNAPSYFC